MNRSVVALEDFGGKTKTTLRHIGHPESIDTMASSGWNESLDKLAEYLKS